MTDFLGFETILFIDIEARALEIYLLENQRQLSILFVVIFFLKSMS